MPLGGPLISAAWPIGPPSHPLELPLFNSDSHRENPSQRLLSLPWVPRKCDKFPPKDTTASELCPCPTCLGPDHPLGTYLKESAGMTLQTSQGKDNPGPDNSSLCLADCTSSLERVSSSWPTPPFLLSILLSKARVLSLSPGHSEGVVSFSDPKSAPQPRVTLLSLRSQLRVLLETHSREAVCTQTPQPQVSFRTPSTQEIPSPLFCFLIVSSLCFFFLILYRGS